jgi:hypothetical protein
MDTNKILELAAENESDLYSERVWAFDEGALIAFAQAIIEAERETHGITVPLAVWDKLKDANTVKDLLVAMKAAEKYE